MSAQCDIHEPLTDYAINEQSDWIDNATIAIDSLVGKKKGIEHTKSCMICY